MPATERSKKLSIIEGFNNLCTDGDRIYKYEPLEVDALTCRGKSRCFVFDKKDIAKVEDILKTIDEAEFNYYMPSRNNICSTGVNGEITYCGEDHHWIQVYSGDVDDLTWTGKFQPNLPKLYELCKEKGIKIIVIDKSYD